MTLEAIVSYRSVPRILELFKVRTPLELIWIPNFTSVINWNLRLGLGLLQQVTSIVEPWVAIIDHSIDIGTKKTLVVLRVTVKALSERASALQLKDCECIGLAVSEKVNGETTKAELDKIFAKSGNPVVIIKDADASLNKGVRLWSEEQEKPVPTIDDIGHVLANALKAQFGENGIFKRFMTLISHGANCLRQTNLAFLIPPKLRTKGRFQSISNIGKWGEKILDIFSTKESVKEGSTLDRLKTAFPDLLKFRSLIERFALTTKIVSQILEILKNKGLDKTTYKQCYELSNELPRNSKVKTRLRDWLKKNLKVKEQVTSLPLVVSSDIIESLFGKFKQIIERSPQADMNRSVLIIPALCGNRNEEIITQALNKASHSDLNKWDKDNIPYTVRKKRQEFFGKKAKNAGKV